MTATFATIALRMRFNLFSRNEQPEPEPQPQLQPAAPQGTTPTPPMNGKTFPADEVVWGIVIRNGFDELDDPWYHRGTTQHAYLEGNDNVAICGFRPPQSGPRTRRRARLGLPTTGEHPMCGMCARMVVAPRPRVPIAVRPARPPVPVPVTAGAPGPVATAAPVAPRTAPVGPPPANGHPAGPVPTNGKSAAPTTAAAPARSPWVTRAAGDTEPNTVTLPLASSHDSGLLARGVHMEVKGD